MIPIEDSIPRRSPPIMVYFLILANAVVFFFVLLLSEENLTEIFYLFGIVPARFSDPAWADRVGFPNEYWAFLTSMFLHGGWLHLLLNMWSLYIFGDSVEDRMGHSRFLLFYLTCGLGSGLIHWLTNPHSIIPAVGASGAIAGVMGAYLILFPKARLILLVPILFLPFFVQVPAVFFILFWFYLQLISGAFSLLAPENAGGIAWWAHIGGFLAGLVLLPIFKRPAKEDRRRQRDEYGWVSAWKGHHYS